MTIIELGCFTVQYDDGPAVFEPLSIRIEPGDRVGIAGESGCGKTSILRAIAGLLPASARISGTRRIDCRIGYIPQLGLSSLSPYLTIGDQVTELTRSGAETQRLLSRVQLGESRYLKAYPHQLSGGQRQRVLAVQALAVRPQVLVADEPTANLDPENEDMILGILREYCNETGAAIVIASHREQVFQALGCRVERLTPAPEPTGSLVPPNSPSRPLVSIRQLSKTYFVRDWLTRTRPVVQALDQVSLDIGVGESIAILGPSGAGKSTLARLIAGRETGDSGAISWHGVSARRNRVQLVQQEPSESLNPRVSLGEALAEASGTADPELLSRVCLPREWIGRKLRALSEGQRARVAIARSVSSLQGGLLILDESLSGLDPSTRTQIVRYLREVQVEQELGILLITHDLEIARELGTRVVRMDSGRIAA